MKIIISKLHKGFTIIESLVAISILMIAITGPLTVANRGYTAALDAKYEAAGLNYAQEALEYISNLKDNHTWGSWVQDTDFDDTVSEPYKSCDYNDNISNLCDFSSMPNLPASISTMNPASVFTARKYYFRKENPYQVTATVVVVWTLGGTDHTITLNQVLTNYER